MVSLTIINSPLHEREEALASTVRGFFLRRRPFGLVVAARILIPPKLIRRQNRSFLLLRGGRRRIVQ